MTEKSYLMELGIPWFREQFIVKAKSAKEAKIKALKKLNMGKVPIKIVKFDEKKNKEMADEVLKRIEGMNKKIRKNK
jgi:hypothetical protein